MYAAGIDVVVVNYNTPDDLKTFVDAYLFQSSVVDSELLVVDVDPTEENYEKTKDYLADLNVPLQYWPMSYNCGYSGACNFASSFTDREVIAFFNADTKLHDKTLDDCYDALMSDDTYGILGPMQVNSAGKLTHAGIFGTNSKPELRGWQKHPSRYADVRDDAISVSGSAYFVKRECWDSMAHDPEWNALYPGIDGAMLPTPHYYEETWCSYFARHKGWKVVYLGSSMMHHEWHKSFPKNTAHEQQVMKQSRSMFRNTCDHFGIERD